MPPEERMDPYRGFNFRVEIDNVGEAYFSEAGGLTFDVDPVDYREGTDKWLHVRKLTGLRKFSNITLKRGYTTNKELWNWYKDVLDGKPDIRRNGAIVLQDEEHNDTPLRWEFQRGWVCKWEGPAMNATSNDVAIESIEICVERVELA
jgi:phage tail-like protein